MDKIYFTERRNSSPSNISRRKPIVIASCSPIGKYVYCRQNTFTMVTAAFVMCGKNLFLVAL